MYVVVVLGGDVFVYFFGLVVSFYFVVCDDYGFCFVVEYVYYVVLEMFDYDVYFLCDGCWM